VGAPRFVGKDLRRRIEAAREAAFLSQSSSSRSHLATGDNQRDWWD